MWQIRAAALLPLVVIAPSCGDNREGPVDAAIERCATDPCRNDGACTNIPSGTHCECLPGFDGDHCELARWTLPVPTLDLDLLFVIDNSGSMQSEQQRLVAAFGDLLAAMTEAGGVLPNLHVGVVSSDVGAAGQSGVPGCATPGDDGNLQATVGTTGMHCPSLAEAFASDIATSSGRETNYTGLLTDTFACLSTLGTTGCGFEMHLESAWRALQPDKNPGFYRPGAQLAVIVVADEDDCSTRDGALFGDPAANLDSVLGPRTSFRCHEHGVVCDDDPTPRAFGEKSGCRPIANPLHEFPVAKYVDFFQELKSDPRRLFLAGLLGAFDGSHLTVDQDPSPGAPVGYPVVKRSCGYSETDPDAGASPPVRLAAFLGSFPSGGLHASVCDASFTDTMQRIGTEVAANMASVLCVDVDLATDDTDAGPTPRCNVALATANGESTIPHCVSGQATPCWNAAADARCPGATNAIWVTLGATPMDGTIDVECETR